MDKCLYGFTLYDNAAIKLEFYNFKQIKHVLMSRLKDRQKNLLSYPILAIRVCIAQGLDI